MKWLKKVAATPLTTIARVIDSVQEQANDRINAPSIHAVREAVNNNWLNIYPIGSIYMNTTNVDPSTLFGGTWEQIKDKFLLACGDTYNNGATGGSATHSYTPAGEVGNHKLTVDEIPPHNHRVSTTGIQNGSGSWGSGLQGTGLDYITTNTGGGQAHNHSFTGTPATIDNMPPYLTVYVWQRVA